jgi:hypothetical protein
MGINVQLEDENSICLESLTKPLPTSYGWENLPSYESSKFPLIGAIDPYGDTVFNTLQMKKFVQKWQLLIDTADSFDRVLMEAVQQLAETCQN